jgi:hypothetical protein
MRIRTQVVKYLLQYKSALVFFSFIRDEVVVSSPFTNAVEKFYFLNFMFWRSLDPDLHWICVQIFLDPDPKQIL